MKVVGGKGGDGRVSFLSVYMIEFAGSLYIEIKCCIFCNLSQNLPNLILN